MTTVVCDLKGCAADTLMDDMGMAGHTVKIYSTLQGVAGFAGTVTDGLLFIDWLNGGDRDEILEQMSDDFAGILSTPTAVVTFESTLIPIRLLDSHYAIGSGAAPAMGAMNDGKTRREAVKAAMKVDIGTGGEIMDIKGEIK